MRVSMLLAMACLLTTAMAGCTSSPAASANDATAHPGIDFEIVNVAAYDYVPREGVFSAHPENGTLLTLKLTNREFQGTFTLAFDRNFRALMTDGIWHDDPSVPYGDVCYVAPYPEQFHARQGEAQTCHVRFRHDAGIRMTQLEVEWTMDKNAPSTKVTYPLPAY